jgi:DNA-binding MarR family transcriptional regulator
VSDRDNTIARITRAQQRLLHHFAFDRSDPLIAANLTMPQLKALLILSLRPEASGQDVMEGMGVSLATVTGIMDRLAERGLITRREDPRDRRVRRLRLTKSGHELVDGIMTAGSAHHRRLLGWLDAEELLVVERALSYLLKAAEAERDAADRAKAESEQR